MREKALFHLGMLTLQSLRETAVKGEFSDTVIAQIDEIVDSFTVKYERGSYTINFNVGQSPEIIEVPASYFQFYNTKGDDTRWTNWVEFLKLLETNFGDKPQLFEINLALAGLRKKSDSNRARKEENVGSSPSTTHKEVLGTTLVVTLGLIAALAQQHGSAWSLDPLTITGMAVLASALAFSNLAQVIRPSISPAFVDAPLIRWLWAALFAVTLAWGTNGLDPQLVLLGTCLANALSFCFLITKRYVERAQHDWKIKLGLGLNALMLFASLILGSVAREVAIPVGSMMIVYLVLSGFFAGDRINTLARNTPAIIVIATCVLMTIWSPTSYVPPLSPLWHTWLVLFSCVNIAICVTVIWVRATLETWMPIAFTSIAIGSLMIAGLSGATALNASVIAIFLFINNQLVTANVLDGWRLN